MAAETLRKSRRCNDASSFRLRDMVDSLQCGSPTAVPFGRIVAPDVGGTGFEIRHRRQRALGIRLVPKRRAGPVVLGLRQLRVGDLLDRDAALLLPGDRVGQVPAVHRDEVLLVQAAPVVEERRLLDAPGQADIVLAAGAADGGKFLVAVHVDLDFPFAPPLLGMQIADANHRADVAPLLLSQGRSSKSFFCVVGFSRRKSTCSRPTSSACWSPSV